MGCVCDASSCLQKSLLSQSVGCIQRWSGVTQSPVTVRTSVCPRALHNTRGPHSACSLGELLPRDLRRCTWDWARAKSCLDPTLLFHQWKHQSSPLRLVDRNCAQPARQSVFWGGCWSSWILISLWILSSPWCGHQPPKPQGKAPQAAPVLSQTVLFFILGSVCRAGWESGLPWPQSGGEDWILCPPLAGAVG